MDFCAGKGNQFSVRIGITCPWSGTELADPGA